MPTQEPVMDIDCVPGPFQIEKLFDRNMAPERLAGG
jgi:hypothetical protein